MRRADYTNRTEICKLNGRGFGNGKKGCSALVESELNAFQRGFHYSVCGVRLSGS